MRVALVGAGHIARIHAPAIRACKGNEIVAVVDEDISRAEAFARELGVESFHATVGEMLKAVNPDVVHVVTSPQGHAAPTIEALEHGSHVLVEKPMAMNAAEAKCMLETAQRCDRRLCVNHNMAFEPTIRKCLDRAKSGDIGDIVSIDTELIFNPQRMASYVEEGARDSHWIYRLNGGPLEDLIPHPISIILDALDSIDDMKVTMTSRGALGGGWNDEIRAMFTSGDKLATLRISLSERPDTMTITVRGTRGQVTADPFTGIISTRKRSCLPRAAIRGLSGFQIAGQYFCGATANVFRFVTGRIDKSNGITPLTKRFYAALDSGDALPVPPEKGMAAVEIMDQIWPEPQVKREEVVVEPQPADGPLALVTGAAGFVGFHIVKKLLADGWRVRALVRKNSLHTGRLKRLPVELVEGNLADRDSVFRAVEGVDTIYHLGSAMSNDWKEHEAVTVGGTLNVVDAALEYKVRKIAFTSTLAVYELLDLPALSVINEASAYQKDAKKLGPYAACKIEAEKLFLAACRERGLDGVILRLGMVLGPLSRVFYPHLGYSLGTDVFIPIGSGKMVLPLVYVDNVVEGIVAASRSDATGGKVYNLVDDGDVSVNTFLKTFRKVTKAPSKIVHMPYFMAWGLTVTYELVSGLGLIKKGATSRAQLKWKQSDMRYDSSRARKDFGWTSTVSLEEGMQRTFQWYKDKYGV